MKKITLMVLITFMMGAVFLGAQEEQWARFDPSPLEIISPEEESLSNPPFFHWHWKEEADSYRIVLQGIEEEKEWETSRNFFTAGEFLPTGFYSVRVKAFNEEGELLDTSREKEFRITEDSVGFEADWEDVQFPKGKRFFIDDEQLQTLREAEDSRQDYRERIVEKARETDVQEILDLQEPDEYEDDTWDRDQWNRINQAGYTVDGFMQQQVMAYLLTSEEQFAENSLQALEHIAEWDPVGSTGVWSSDHSAQSMMHALTTGYSTFRDRMDDELKDKVAANIRRRAEDMYRFLNPFQPKETASGMMNDPDNNHPWFCSVTLANGAMALMGEVEEAEEWLSFAIQMFHGVFLPRGDSTGGWHEGIDYWSYMLYYVMQFAHSLQVIDSVDLFHHPWLENTAIFKIVTHPPAGAHVPFGNCHHQSPNHFDQLIMIKLASVYQEPQMWKYVDHIDDTMHESRLFFALLWYDRDEKEGEVDIAPFHHFEDMGWVVALSDVFEKEEQVLFAMRSGPFFGRRFNHAHADQNHFIVAAGGDELIWDAGYYDGYLADHHRHFTVQSIAHNVPLFDGEGQVVFTPGADGKITRFEEEENRLVVEGDASEPIIYGGRAVKFIRTITMEDFQSFVVEDDIQADYKRQISWLLQSAYPIYYEQDTRRIRIEGDNYKIVGTFETDEDMEAELRDTFPIPPEGRNDRDYPEQYRLELRTVEEIEFWEPSFSFEVLPKE